VVTGSKTVIHAIVAGRRAAYGIDLRLSQNKETVSLIRFYGERHTEERYRPNAVGAQARASVLTTPVAERIRNFFPIEGVLSEAEARAEAKRCLVCGLCSNCDNCIDNFGCPALFRDGHSVMINEELCNGCGVCIDLCPNDAIVAVAVP
jgi:Pyruvate/2-oxoacid:ferredoxin oxidoreductase delta subunit